MSYQDSLKRQLKKYLFIITLFLSVIFIAIFLTADYFSEEQLVDEKLVEVEKSFNDITSMFRQKSRDISSNESYLKLISGDETMASEVKLDNYLFVNKADFIIEFEMYDLELKSIINKEQITSAIYDAYLSLIYDRLINGETFGLINYRGLNEQQYVIFYSGVYEFQELVGFLIYRVPSSDLAFSLFSSQGDYIITDYNNSILVNSNKEFASSYNKFYYSPEISRNDTLYRVSERESLDYQIYYLEEIQTNGQDFLITIIIFIAVIIFLIYFVLMKLIDKFAKDNTKTINKIIDDSSLITQGDLDHRIDEKLDSDFKVLAMNINMMLERLNDEIKNNIALNEMNILYEKKKLEAQFNPHLLYNSLETIRYTMSYDLDGTKDFILDLTDILRYSINNDEDSVKLSYDIFYVEKFLNLYKYRLKDNFSYKINISSKLGDLLIPKLCLQPIIENSIKYGFKNKTRIHVEIDAFEDEENIYLIVRDDGVELAEDLILEINNILSTVKNTTTHIGLHNIARRLKIMYPRSRVEMFNDSGIKVQICLKKEKVHA